MAQDFVPKRLTIGIKSRDFAGDIVRAVEGLAANSKLLAESGGSFSDGDDQATPPIPSDFAGEVDMSHANSYIFNVLLGDATTKLLDLLANEGVAADGSGPKIGAILRAAMGA